EAVALDHVGLEPRADVANAARRELGDALARRRVHDELAPGVAAAAAQGTAWLRRHVRWTRGACAVMDCAKRVACFVGKDLPLRVRPNDDVGRGNSLVVALAIAVIAGACTAQLSAPRQADGGV